MSHEKDLHSINNNYKVEEKDLINYDGWTQLYLITLMRANDKNKSETSRIFKGVIHIYFLSENHYQRLAKIFFKPTIVNKSIIQSINKSSS